MPKFSVIMPCYNAEKFIHVALSALFEQTYGDFEIIVIDDCSTDLTPVLLDYYQKKDKRLKVYRNDINRGPGYCRNLAMKKAQGEYIVSVDADDRPEETLLQDVLDKFEQYDVSSVWFKSTVYSYREDSFQELLGFKNLLMLKEGLFEITPENIYLYPGYSWNKVYKKSSIKENMYYPETYLFEDDEFYWRYYTQNPDIYFIDKSLYLHITNEDSLLDTCTEEKFEKQFDMMGNINKYLREEGLLWKYGDALLRLFGVNMNIYIEVFRDLPEEEIEKTMQDGLNKINYPQDYLDIKTSIYFPM